MFIKNIKKMTKNSKKIQSKANYALMQFDKQIEGVSITKPSSFGWVKWGIKNDYPNQLLNLYANSPTHASCINFGVQALIGEGVDYEAMQLDSSQIQPNYYQNWNEVLRSLALDFQLYGSYCIEIIKNKDGKSFSFYHIPLEKVRWSEYDSDGQITSYWLSRDWTNSTKYQPIQLPAFDMLEDGESIKQGQAYLYVYRPYSPLNTYYQSPHYISSIKAIQSEIEYLNFDLKSTANSFVPAGMLVLNDVETDEQRQGLVDNIQKMFVGSDNANSLMISFRSNVDDSKPEFVPFSTSTGNINLFDSANQRNINRILSAHQIPNASLVGMPDVNGSGFASEADKLEVAFNLYNKLVGNYNRKCIVDCINSALRMNGIDVELILKPLSFLNDEVQVKDDTTAAEKQDNIEEKVEE